MEEFPESTGVLDTGLRHMSMCNVSRGNRQHSRHKYRRKNKFERGLIIGVDVVGDVRAVL